MPPAHRNTSKAAERRARRRQRREGQQRQRRERTQETPRIAPLQLDPRKTQQTPVATTTSVFDANTEYRIVQRDLVRLTIFSVICFVVMVAALLVLNM